MEEVQEKLWSIGVSDDYAKCVRGLKQRYGPLQSEVSYYVVDRDKKEKNKQLRFHQWIGKTSVSVVLLA